MDGPAAAGKGTLARALAERFRLVHLDTGLLYRVTALFVLERGELPSDPKAAAAAARRVDGPLLGDPRLREERVGAAASIVAGIPAVRRALLAFQRGFAAHPPPPAKGAVLVLGPASPEPAAIDDTSRSRRAFRASSADGRALRRYLENAWPHVAWEEVYRPFLDEYTPCCRLDALEPVRSLEMAARCVVEMGTTSYYTTLSRASPEPVLSVLAGRIAQDEVRHYKHFYRYFRKYREAKKVRRSAVAGALWRRLRMTEGEDSYIALKHAYRARHPGRPFDPRVHRAIRRQFRSLFRPHFPHAMSVKMLLKPLGLAPRARNVVQSLAEALARRLVA